METVFYTSFERAVVDLEQAVCRDRSHVVLATSPGPGRGALTRLLEERLSGSLRPLEIPVPTATHDEIRARIVHQLGGDPNSISEQKMTGLLREIAASGSALLLLIRDADAMPVETLRWLGGLAAQSGNGLRLVLVVTVEGGAEGGLISGLIAALGVGVQKVVLEAPGEWEGRPAPVSPSAAVSPISTPVPGVHPWRSRIETLQAQTVRMRDPRQSRWGGRASFAAALLLVALGVHHLAFVPLPRDSTASSDSSDSGRAVPATPQAQHMERSPQRDVLVDAATTRSNDSPQARPATQSRFVKHAARPMPTAAKVEPDTGIGPPELVATHRAGKAVIPPRPNPAASRAQEPPLVAEVAIAERATEQGATAVAEAASEPQRDAEEPARDDASAAALPVAAVSLGSANGSSIALAGLASAPSAASADGAMDFSASPGTAATSQVSHAVHAVPAAPAAMVESFEFLESAERTEKVEAVQTGTAEVAVSINARPWARIRVDGQDVGITPLANLKLSPGPHRFHARLSDGRVFERTMHVDEYRDRISFP
jgi:hypothetical protein